MNSFFFPQACDLQVACYALFHYEIESPDVQEMLNFHEVWFMCIISVGELCAICKKLFVNLLQMDNLVISA